MTDIKWNEDGSLAAGQQPDEEPMPDEPELTEYLVKFEDEDGSDAGDYTFMAESPEHAREQAEDAEPKLKIVSIEPLQMEEDEDEETDYTDLLTPQEIRDGGAYRKDEKGRRYWLNLPQLAEFTRMDDSLGDDTESDRKFWGWFKDFIEVNKIKADASYTPPKQKRGLTTPQWSSYWDNTKTKAKTYLSDWWGGSGYYKYGGFSDETKKLAVALQAVQSTVRVIDNNVKRMRVQFSRDDGGAPQSFTAYDERLISVSPMAILDKKIAEGEGIDITTGFALHEASHAEYSEASLSALEKPTHLEPLAVAGTLHNLFEDIRIEQLTSNEFPGFAGYFEKGREYMWPHVQEHAPKEYGPDLDDKINSVIAGVKWPTQYKGYAEDASVDLATEMQWWRDLSDSYSGGHRDMRETLELAMARLREDPKTKQEMTDLAKKEKEAQAAGNAAMPFADLPQAVKDAIKQWLQNGGDVITVCPSPDKLPQGPGNKKEDPSAVKLKAHLAGEVSELADSGMNIETTGALKIPELGNNPPKFVTLHPLETVESKANWTPPLRGLVARMRSAFFFRPVAQQWTTRLQRSGALDEDEVWRAAPALGKERDFRVFEQRNVESSPDTTITLLIDISGSMYGQKMRTGVQAAAIMHEVLKATPGVRIRVRAHTGDVAPGDRGDVVLYKVWESGEPVSRLGIPETVPHGNNYDGYAIGWCVREMLQHQKPDEQRLLIVLSDGYPHGSAYGGRDAMRHVKETQAWARRQGVSVIQIAIDPSMDLERQAEMFENFIPFTTLEDLPAQITGILKKAIK